MMTQRYAHLRDEALRRASNLAGDLIQQTIKDTETKRKKKGQSNRSEPGRMTPRRPEAGPD
jgi:hypothetical protein